MKLETVGRVSVCNLRFEIGWQIDNVDSSKWALLGTDTASYAKTFGDEGDLGLRGDFDTEATTSDDGAGLFAFLTAFL